MTKNTVPAVDENLRRYYLDVMGVQCWQLLDTPAADTVQIEPVLGGSGQIDNSETATIDNNESLTLSCDETVQHCRQCGLHQTRQQALPGRGTLSADLMFVVLAPSSSDDESGLLCGGEASALLEKMLTAIDIKIENIYLASLLKCAVAENHTVSAEEIQSCLPHLKQQIQHIQPKLLVLLGESAAQGLLQKDVAIDDYRAMNAEGQQQLESLPLFISYSPQELLLQPENKRKAWADLQQLQKIISQL